MLPLKLPPHPSELGVLNDPYEEYVGYASIGG
jgi:hypothetical protein